MIEKKIVKSIEVNEKGFWNITTTDNTKYIDCYLKSYDDGKNKVTSDIVFQETAIFDFKPIEEK